MLAEIAAFVSVSAVVICTPGPDTALTVRNALAGGRGSGICTGAGVAIGQCVWTVAAGLGLAGVLRASEPAFLAIKSAGAAYLIYLGARSLLAARSRAGHESGTGCSALLVSPVRALRQGLVSDLGNPKMAAFFISLLPQFTGSGPASLATFMAFGFLFSVLTFSWLAAYSFAVAKARTFLDRPRIRRALDAITGCVLIGLGVRVAAERA